MKNELNELTQHLLNLENVKTQYSQESLEKVNEIACWALERAEQLMEEHKTFDLVAEHLQRDIKNYSPLLDSQSIKDIILYVHFYTCR